MAKEGSKCVEICEIDDKRQITAVLGVIMTGDFLPVQLIYQGKTPKCHPSYQFSTDWYITNSTNHWSKKETMKDHVLKTLVPYIDKRKDLRLSSNHHALVIYDTFKDKCTPDILDLLREPILILSLYLPTALTAYSPWILVSTILPKFNVRRVSTLVCRSNSASSS